MRVVDAGVTPAQPEPPRAVFRLPVFSRLESKGRWIGVPGNRRPMTTVELLELDRKERMLREMREKGLRDYISLLDYARERARQAGYAEAKAEIARNMLAMGMEASLVAELTGLTREEIEDLRKQPER